MGFWNNIKNFAQPYAADDDYDDDEYYDDEPEADDGFEREERTAPRQDEFASDSTFASGVSGTSFGTGSTGFGQSSSAPTFHAGSATPGQTVREAIEKHQLVLCVPTAFSDSPGFAANLLQNKAVILNLDGLQDTGRDLSRRTVDFLYGCTFALRGSVKKVSQTVYLFCPPDMEVLGSLSDFQTEIEDYI